LLPAAIPRRTNWISRRSAGQLRRSAAHAESSHQSRFIRFNAFLLCLVQLCAFVAIGGSAKHSGKALRPMLNGCSREIFLAQRIDKRPAAVNGIGCGKLVVEEKALHQPILA
jgi:hypothetical protein